MNSDDPKKGNEGGKTTSDAKDLTLAGKWKMILSKTRCFVWPSGKKGEYFEKIMNQDNLTFGMIVEGMVDYYHEYSDERIILEKMGQKLQGDDMSFAEKYGNVRARIYFFVLISFSLGIFPVGFQKYLDEFASGDGYGRLFYKKYCMMENGKMIAKGIKIEDWMIGWVLNAEVSIDKDNTKDIDIAILAKSKFEACKNIERNYSDFRLIDIAMDMIDVYRSFSKCDYNVSKVKDICTERHVSLMLQTIENGNKKEKKPNEKDGNLGGFTEGNELIKSIM